VTPATCIRARASASRKSSIAWLRHVVVFVWLLLAGACAVWSNDAVRVTVSFTGSTPQTQLRNLTVVSGNDRYSWDALASGDSRDINLLPDAAGDRRLTFLYTLDEQAMSWEGPAIPLGAGYRIAIAVDAQGRITERHCLLPCSLD
jgi:hypothetical protein